MYYEINNRKYQNQNSIFTKKCYYYYKFLSMKNNYNFIFFYIISFSILSLLNKL